MLLWKWKREQFHDFMAALIVLSMAAFTTYLLMPAAPPWYAAREGLLNGADGLPLIAYLKPETFADIGATLGDFFGVDSTVGTSFLADLTE